ncbi:LolA family protein [Thermoanaerobacterium thermosaccharolyticum]|uniref:Outer membrane lipoprotein-sorting protein n=1 Tax=Thermoanaerobacterium thermosaccharolyticum M0795 TaxID=698948 RepID=L0IHA5_THETR|nr:outer membrane lipoprotein carrier protein LolA [Thermoanaerobacterium thermosaccharolyticum]AGB18223.1 outer membrane lipoprotein-sorting protein [Thermoanaerobacterium thermosaccharolyticum M0795]
MKRLLLALLLMMTIAFSGCIKKSQGDAFSNIKKSLDNLKSYTSDGYIELHNNKNVKKYSMKQFYKDGKYRMEIYDESDKPDKVIVFDGSRSYVYFSKVNQTFIEDNSENIPAYSLFASFINNFKMAGEIKKEDGVESYSIDVPIPEGNTFMYNEVMEFSKKDFKPSSMKIYDIKGELFAEIKYKNFMYNPQLDDGLFSQSDISTFSRYMNIQNDLSLDIKDVYKYTGINPVFPEYMPKNYVLVNVSIDMSNNNAISLTYLNGNDIIKIVESVYTFDGKGFDKKKSGDISYYKKDNQYVVDRNGLIIDVFSNGNVSSDEVLMILNSLI